MTKKKEKSAEIRHLDAIDRQILNILCDNAREKLTKIARTVQLSADSTKKRIEKLEKDGVIDKYTIQPNPRIYGIPMGVHVYIKLKNINMEKYNELIKDMMKNTRVIDLMAMIGNYDLYIVFLAKDQDEFEKMKLEVREKFGSIIGSWDETIVSKLYKLEVFKF